MVVKNEAIIGKIEDITFSIDWENSFIELDNGDSYDMWCGISINFKKLEQYIKILQEIKEKIKEV